MQKYEILLQLLQRKSRELLNVMISQIAFETVLLRAHSFALLCAIARLISINKQTDARRYPCAQTETATKIVVIMQSLSRRWMTSRAWETRRQDVKRRSRGAVTCKGWGTKDEGMCSGIYRSSSPIPRILFRASRICSR